MHVDGPPEPGALSEPARDPQPPALTPVPTGPTVDPTIAERDARLEPPRA